jgi:hypothetical protein
VGKKFFTVSTFSTFSVSGPWGPGQKSQNPENVLTVKKHADGKLGWQ